MGGVDADFFNSTAGLRGFKGSVYEGGIRVPCIVRWPGVTPAATTTEVPSYFPDWFPTLCDIAGTKAPADLDGDTLVPLFQPEKKSQESFQRRKPLIWEFHGYRGQLAVMDGKWKAVRQKVRTKQPGAWELYDLDQDHAESSNLSKKHPEVLQRLEKAFLADRSNNKRYPLRLYE